MFVIKLAELNIAIKNKYDYIHNMCNDYLTSDEPDFTVCASDNEILAERNESNEDTGYLESLAIYRKIADILPRYTGLLLHASVIDVLGLGVAFLAKSGVGKSTHTMLWKELLGESVSIINGDKPIVRVSNGKIFAYGTPWAGKENWHTNSKTELKKICFIERSEENQCTELNKNDVLEGLLNQVYIPKNSGDFLLTLELLDAIVENTRFYLIKCNKDIQSAKTAFKGLGL